MNIKHRVSSTKYRQDIVHEANEFDALIKSHLKEAEKKPGVTVRCLGKQASIPHSFHSGKQSLTIFMTISSDFMDVFKNLVSWLLDICLSFVFTGFILGLHNNLSVYASQTSVRLAQMLPASSFRMMLEKSQKCSLKTSIFKYC